MFMVCRKAIIILFVFPRVVGSSLVEELGWGSKKKRGDFFAVPKTFANEDPLPLSEEDRINIVVLKFSFYWNFVARGTSTLFSLPVSSIPALRGFEAPRVVFLGSITRGLREFDNLKIS